MKQAASSDRGEVVIYRAEDGRTALDVRLVPRKRKPERRQFRKPHPCRQPEEGTDDPLDYESPDPGLGMNAGKARHVVCREAQIEQR